MSDIISKKTRQELREYFVGTTLSVINDEFGAADIDCVNLLMPEVNGARRSLVEQYYASIDWKKWSDVRKFITVYEHALNTLEDQVECGNEYAEPIFKKLVRSISKDGFIYEKSRITRDQASSGLDHINHAKSNLDLPQLDLQIKRLSQSIETDPALAIGTAKELVETTCKTILEERQLAFADDADIGTLVKEARKALGLIPESVPNSAKGAETIRRLLSNLGNVAQGLGELRNLYGTGHGKTGNAKGLSPRHAKLAVGAAATLATFLLETHSDRAI